jgi:hypothetical protein
MPGIVSREGLADEVLPLSELAPGIVRLLSGLGLPRPGAAATPARKPTQR